MDLVIAPTADYDLAAANIEKHWLALGLAPTELRPDIQSATVQFLQAAAREHGGVVMKATLGDRVVGTGCMHLVSRPYPSPRPAESDRVAYIWGVWIDPDVRGRGYGSALVDACVEYARASLGVSEVRLHGSDSSLAWYQGLGFEQTQEMKSTIPS